LSRQRGRSSRGAPGFTLIEVIGALVIFSVGVLMVIQMSGALAYRMRYAGARSTLVVYGNERLDSLEAEPFSTVSAGTTVTALTVEGAAYQSTVTVTTVTPVLKRIQVTVAPVAGSGPTYTTTSYRSAVWDLWP
jgi:prepilin-type N-terminal cleavage/methylation domain-containing protein